MLKNEKEKALTELVPFPMCTVDAQGKVTGASSKISEVFIYDAIKDSDIFILTGVKYKDLLSLEERETPLLISRNDKVFKIIASPLSDEETPEMAVYFMDVTMQESLKKRYNEEKVCMAIINVDNFDELTNSTSAEKRSELVSEIDRIVRQYAARSNASVTKKRDSQYFVVMESGHCDKLIENKFPILDDIRKIETESDFPVTVSIGIGRGGKTLAQTDIYAQNALDLALGRGGDQAVIKYIGKTEYYGGRTQTVEKTNKGKSRIVAHALRHLVDQSNKVLIMGHKNPDMDSFGAALGISRFCTLREQDAYVVLNYYNETLTEIYNQAKNSEAYQFISTEKALSLIDEDTLLMVLDTHRPSYTEAPELLTRTEKIAVIDHHRRAEDAIENPTLSYMESYASSTCELVGEMLQYAGEKKSVITKFEAEALLAGIAMDTNNFAVKTGVRTFEVASWLRRAGADTTTVKRFFQMDSESFMLRAKSIANAKFIYDGSIAVSILEGKHVDTQILNAQVADELLEVKGVKASFVAGTTSTDKTVVSARSLGEINVQVIMEKLGGGGHLTTAGAQVKESPEEIIEIIEKMLEPKEAQAKEV